MKLAQRSSRKTWLCTYSCQLLVPENVFFQHKFTQLSRQKIKCWHRTFLQICHIYTFLKWSISHVHERSWWWWDGWQVADHCLRPTDSWKCFNILAVFQPCWRRQTQLFFIREPEQTLSTVLSLKKNLSITNETYKCNISGGLQTIPTFTSVHPRSAGWSRSSSM